MSDDAIQAPPTPEEIGELRSAISAFEQILEIMPEDPTALQTLTDAYRRLGETDKSAAFLLRLADAVAEETDPDVLQSVLERLETAGASDDATSAAARLRARLDAVGASAAATAAAPAPAPAAAGSGDDIAGELALAWTLYQRQEITQEEYAGLARDLTEMSTRKVDVPVSLLHVLHDRGYKNPDRIMNFIARESGCPCVPLKSFDVPRDLAGRLPLEFSQRRGALVFGQLGNELMIATLNPLDQALRDQVARMTGARCHFFLVTAEDYDSALKSMKPSR